jgi:hypothetical protein
MDFTKEQLSEAFIKHLDREKGLGSVPIKSVFTQ